MQESAVIKPGTKFQIATLKLDELIVKNPERLFPAKVATYVELYTDPANDKAHADFIMVEPAGDKFDIVNGRHRFAAAMIAGRTHLLAIILTEPAEAPIDASPLAALDSPDTPSTSDLTHGELKTDN